MPVFLPSFAEPAARYEGFIFDVWGTLYDGGAAFPGAAATIEALAARGRKLLVLSNSPRNPEIVAKRLAAIGLDPAWFDDIVTSGGMVAERFASRRTAEAAGLGPRVFWCGQARFPDTLHPDSVSGSPAEAGGFVVVDRIGDADWLLNAGPERPDARLEEYEGLLLEAAGRSLPMVCANPDKAVVQRGERQICAGALAARYEALGGNVRYFGKPFAEIFTLCLARLALPADRVLMVGDNLETDILGANRSGIDSLLLGTGIHAGAGKVGTGESGDAGEIPQYLRPLMEAHGAVPTFFAPSLAPGSLAEG